MTMQRAKLADIQYVGSSAATIYTNPSSTKSFIRSIVLHNTNTTTETVKLYVVPDAGGSVGTASAASRILNIALASNETFVWDMYPITLSDTNDTLQAETTTASKVTVLVCGDKDA